jgi:hypothetical protein
MSRTFTITNRTGYLIDQIYLSPSGDSSWESDLLGEYVLPDAELQTITLYREHPGETWDLKVVFDDDEEDVWSELTIGGANNITLSYDDNEGALADVT